MNTENLTIDEIDLLLERKNIKNMYIRICDDGTIKVSVPKQIRDEDIKKFVSSRKKWILEHQATVLAKQKENPFKNNFTHLELWGQVYPIEIINTTARAKVELQDDKVFMYLNAETKTAVKEKLINEWYRNILKKEISIRIPEWEKVVGVKVDEWHIKNMRTKWGTCNVKAKRIWLNLQLAKKPLECLDYVIIHELTHLLERSHNAVFKGYMDEFCPDWRQIRKSLNR